MDFWDLLLAAATSPAPSASPVSGEPTLFGLTPGLLLGLLLPLATGIGILVKLWPERGKLVVETMSEAVGSLRGEVTAMRDEVIRVKAEAAAQVASAETERDLKVGKALRAQQAAEARASRLETELANVRTDLMNVQRQLDDLTRRGGA